MDLLYSSIVTVVVGLIVAIGVGWYFNWRAKKLTIELSQYLIKQCSGKVVHPIFDKNGKITGSEIIQVVSESVDIVEKIKK